MKLRMGWLDSDVCLQGSEVEEGVVGFWCLLSGSVLVALFSCAIVTFGWFFGGVAALWVVVSARVLCWWFFGATMVFRCGVSGMGGCSAWFFG
ncbi:hypothetical protein QL285_058986 [Trifolium repens]|jgi:hypothetical protein|nr:hypothetical protein QL285_058986 [Trifolium repens]